MVYFLEVGVEFIFGGDRYVVSLKSILQKHLLRSTHFCASLPPCLAPSFSEAFKCKFLHAHSLSYLAPPPPDSRPKQRLYSAETCVSSMFDYLACRMIRYCYIL
jgi:hypothetical protein